MQSRLGKGDRQAFESIFFNFFAVDPSSWSMVVLHCSTGTVVSDTYKDDGDYPLFFGVPAWGTGLCAYNVTVNVNKLK